MSLEWLLVLLIGGRIVFCGTWYEILFHFLGVSEPDFAQMIILLTVGIPSYLTV